MKKYFQVIKGGFQKVLEYRSTEIIWVLVGAIPTIIFMTLWKNNSFEIIEKSNLVTYYFLMLLSLQLFTPHLEHNVAKAINDGDLKFYLLKPINYLLRTFFYEIPWKIISYIFSVIPICLLLIAYQDLIIIPNLDIGKILIYLAMGILTYILISLIQLTLGGLAFFITDIRSFFRAWHFFSELFSGKMVPAFLLPTVLKNINKVLPFKYFWYYPTQYMLDSSEINAFRNIFIIQIIWIIISALFTLIIWKEGIKRYSSFGD